MSAETIFRHRDALLLSLVALGIGLRIWQYAANTSLWVDEIFLASNILHRSMRELLVIPLCYGQVAPTGFLLLEKLSALAFGPSDYALRFVPLVSSIAGLVMFWRIVRRFLRPLAAVFAMTLFATAAPLVTFGSLTKQYSLDVAVAVALLWLSLRLSRRVLSRKQAAYFGVAGATLVWFSQPAVITVLALGGALVLIAWTGSRDLRATWLRSLSPVITMWSVSGLAAALVSFFGMTASLRDFMHQYWAPGLLPSPPSLVLVIHWPWNQMKSLIGSGGQASLAYPHPGIYLVLAALGFWLLGRQSATIATLLLAPIAAIIAAAVARQYPFSDRLILFLLPSFFIALAVSVDWMYRKLTAWSKYLGWLAVIAVMGPAVYPIAAMPPPYRIEDMKSIMAYLQANRRPGDAVYVFNGATLAFGFYSREYGFRDSDYSAGGCHRGENRRYLDELDKFRGRPRVWVVVTHALPSYKERDDILHYLDTIGVRRDTFAVESRVVGNWALPAELWLFDLSDSRRLGVVSSASMPLIGPVFPGGCGDATPVVVPPRTF